MAGFTMIPTDCNRSQSNAPVNEWLTTLPAAKYVTFWLVSGNFFSALTLRIFGVWTCPKTRKVCSEEGDPASAGTPVTPSSNSAARKLRIFISDLMQIVRRAPRSAPNVLGAAYRALTNG